MAFEFKDTLGQLMTFQNKIVVLFPDTRGQYKTFSLDLKNQLISSSKEMVTLAFSDPEGGTIILDDIRLQNTFTKGAISLTNKSGLGYYVE